MFVISTLDGEEIQATDSDRVMISPDTGVLTIQRMEGSERVTTYYSAAAWRSVTHRAKKSAAHSSGSSPTGVITGDDAQALPG